MNLMLFKNNKFDLIVPIGRDCACPSYLTKFNLRRSSYPFDWLTIAPFNVRIELLLNDFNNFILKENLEFVAKNPNEVNDSHCDYYRDFKTDFLFLHDFPIGKSLDESYPMIKEKYDRRIARLYKHIGMHKRILFVYWGRLDVVENEDLKVYKRQIDEKFPNKDISFLILENKSDEVNFVEEHIQKDIIKVKYDLVSYEKNFPEKEWAGNVKLNDKLFSKLTLNISMKEKINKLIFNVFIKYPSFLIPNKQKRKLFREKLNKHLILSRD